MELKMVTHVLVILRDAVFQPLFSFGGSQISVAALILAAGIVAAGYLLSRAIERFLRNYLRERLRLDSGAGYAILRIGRYIILCTAIMIALQSLGLQLTSLTVFGGFLGVGLGFGLQNLTANFISGIILLFEQPIRVGDKVTVAEFIGTVRAIGIRSTEIETFDNVTLILPNLMFVQEKVINWSHGDPRIRLHIKFGVAYGSDVKKLRRVAIKTAEAVEGVLAQPEPELRFVGFGDSSLDFDLLAWIADPRLQFRASSDIYYALETALREEKIEIPFPQRDVHIKSAPPAGAPAATA